MNTLPPGDVSGVGEQVLQLAGGLRTLGVEVSILGRGPAGVRGPKLLFPVSVIGALRRELARLRPDVVQVHESDAGLAMLWLVRRRWDGLRPLLVALQQVSYVEERRAVRPLGSQGRVLGVPGWKERFFRWFKAPLQILLGRWTAHFADLVLAPSRATATELARDYGVKRWSVLPNTSRGPLEAPEAVAHPLPPGGFVLFVGRLRVRKGVEVLLEALKILRQEGWRLPLVIAGDGEHRRGLERRVAELGLEEDVSWLGRVGRGHVRFLLERATLLAVPSIYEGMPLVILEAMAAGVPVVASRVSGIPEVVEAAGCGWLVPPEDPESLAQVLSTAWDAPQERRERGERGREYLERELSPARVAATWKARIEKLQGECGR